MPDSRSRLSASPKAKQAHAKLKTHGRLTLHPGLMGKARAKARKIRPPTERMILEATAAEDAVIEGKAAAGLDRPLAKALRAVPAIFEYIRNTQASLKAQGNPLWRSAKDTSSAGHPTDLRQAKEPEDRKFKTEEKPGGQLQHKPQVYEDVYGKHLQEVQREAIKLIRDAYEAVECVRVTSARAYSGMPFTGGTNDPAMSAKRREYIELATEWFAELNTTTPAWSQWIAECILHIPDERTGRVRSINELGSSVSAYAPRSDGATGVGVGTLNAGLLRALEALQVVLQRRQMRRLAQQGTLTTEPATEKYGLPVPLARRRINPEKEKLLTEEARQHALREQAKQRA
jgi:hypothetical protein